MKLNEKKPKGDQVRIRQPSTAQPATQRQRIFVMVFWGPPGWGKGGRYITTPTPPTQPNPNNPPREKMVAPFPRHLPNPTPYRRWKRGEGVVCWGSRDFFLFPFLSRSLSLSPFFFILEGILFSTHHHLGIGFFSLKKTRKTNRGFVAAPEV